MIIFDLETLADDTHRRHFIDPTLNPNVARNVYYSEGDLHREYYYSETMKLWQPDYEAYNAACDGDELIMPTYKIYECWCNNGGLPVIWTSRCESTRASTKEWCRFHDIYFQDMKMRPIGNTDPAHVLKEKWLHESPKIDFVFDSDPESIDMFRRRGIYVFDCRQV